jgi:sulfur-oxidizing protein SoxY
MRKWRCRCVRSQVAPKSSWGIFGPENPLVTLARFHLGPRSGRAKVSTTVRLANSQKVLAVAQLSDGSFWSGDAYVLVTLAACLDGG